jgi:plastocyanin
VVVTIITQSNGAFAFSPQTLNITAGTTVTWINKTAAPHTVTGNSFGSAAISPGGSYSFKFTQAGTFAYHCMFHPYMTASVSVK